MVVMVVVGEDKGGECGKEHSEVRVRLEGQIFYGGE